MEDISVERRRINDALGACAMALNEKPHFLRPEDASFVSSLAEHYVDRRDFSPRQALSLAAVLGRYKSRLHEMGLAAPSADAVAISQRAVGVLF